MADHDRLEHWAAADPTAIAPRRQFALAIERLLPLAISLPLAFVGLVFLARRVAGALSAPSSLTFAIAIGAALACLVACACLARGGARRVLSQTTPRPALGGVPLDRIAMGSAAIGLASLTIALSFAAIAWFVLALAWMAVAVAAAWTCDPVALHAVGQRLRHSIARPLVPLTERYASWLPTTAPLTSIVAIDATGDDTPSCELVRRKLPDGSHVWLGTLWIEFSAGQRTATEHLPFCPAFPGVPTVEFAQLDGPAARLRLGQALPNGARLEVKLASVAKTAEVVVVEFRAVGPSQTESEMGVRTKAA